MTNAYLTELIQSKLNECFHIIRETKDNYIRLETLVKIELLFEIIKTLHIELAIPNREFYKKLLRLNVEKRHFFRVTLEPKDLEHVFDWSKKP